jgi:hypothetical protein
MVAVAVTTSDSVQVGRRTILFDDEPYLAHAYGAAYDVHPNDRQFVMVRRGSEAPQVVVVLNLFDQLRAAVTDHDRPNSPPR